MDEFEQRLLDAECPSLHISGIDFDLDNSPLPCGFRDIEKHKYLRLGKPDLVVVAARPGVGKTALALQIASNVAERVGPTMFFSLEMDRRQLKQRLYALHSETSINKLHLLPQSRRERLTEKFINMPLYIDDTGGITINELRARAIDFHKRRPLGMVCVDYLQIVGTEQGRTKAEEVAEVAEGLKSLARDLKIPVLALAQMNRMVENRQQATKDARPQMSDIADSAACEKWSDIILFLDRPYLRNRSRPGEIDVYCAKNRHGDTQDFILGFSGELTKAFDMAEVGGL